MTEHHNRDAGTGRYVDEQYTAEHPDTTVREAVGKRPAMAVRVELPRGDSRTFPGAQYEVRDPSGDLLVIGADERRAAYYPRGQWNGAVMVPADEAADDGHVFLRHGLTVHVNIRDVGADYRVVGVETDPQRNVHTITLDAAPF